MNQNYWAGGTRDIGRLVLVVESPDNPAPGDEHEWQVRVRSVNGRSTHLLASGVEHSCKGAEAAAEGAAVEFFRGIQEGLVSRSLPRFINEDPKLGDVISDGTRTSTRELSRLAEGTRVRGNNGTMWTREGAMWLEHSSTASRGMSRKMRTSHELSSLRPLVVVHVPTADVGDA